MLRPSGAARPRGRSALVVLRRETEQKETLTPKGVRASRKEGWIEVPMHWAADPVGGPTPFPMKRCRQSYGIPRRGNHSVDKLVFSISTLPSRQYIVIHSKLVVINTILLTRQTDDQSGKHCRRRGNRWFKGVKHDVIGTPSAFSQQNIKEVDENVADIVKIVGLNVSNKT